jgi:hypothetical protein
MKVLVNAVFFYHKPFSQTAVAWFLELGKRFREQPKEQPKEIANKL